MHPFCPPDDLDLSVSDSKCMVLKVYVTGQETNPELSIYELMNTMSIRHPGKGFIRKLLDNFSIEGPRGRHTCLVHEALGISATELMQSMTLKA